MTMADYSQIGVAQKLFACSLLTQMALGMRIMMSHRFSGIFVSQEIYIEEPDEEKKLALQRLNYLYPRPF